MPDKDFDKQVDLDSTEYRPSDEPEPFWGYAAKPTLILFIVGLVASFIVGRLITGEWHYLVRHYLE